MPHREVAGVGVPQRDRAIELRALYARVRPSIREAQRGGRLRVGQLNIAQGDGVVADRRDRVQHTVANAATPRAAKELDTRPEPHVLPSDLAVLTRLDQHRLVCPPVALIASLVQLHAATV